MVEHDLAKVGVAGSSPVFRSKSSLDKEGIFFSINVYHDWDALVVELVDTQDLKSCGQQWPYRFNSDPGHFLEATLSRVAFFLCICTYRKSGVGSRELVACLPAKAGRESTAPLNWC